MNWLDEDGNIMFTAEVTNPDSNPCDKTTLFLDTDSEMMSDEHSMEIATDILEEQIVKTRLLNRHCLN